MTGKERINEETRLYRAAEARAAALMPRLWLSAGYVAWVPSYELRDASRYARDPDVIRGRRLVAHTLRAAGLSLPGIGRLMDRDHSSVFHLLRTGEDDPALPALVAEYAVTRPIRKPTPTRKAS